MSGSIREAEKARFVAKLGPMVRFREAEKTSFVAQLGPMLRFSGCSAKRTAKCLRTVFRAWAWLGARWRHGNPPRMTQHWEHLVNAAVRKDGGSESGRSQAKRELEGTSGIHGWLM